MATITRAFRVAHASGGDWESLTQSCLAGIGTPPEGANFGFVYVTDPLDEDMRRIVNALGEATGIQSWVGTIGFGVCVSGEELFDLPAMAVMVGSLPRDSFCILPTVKDPADGVPAEVRDWAARHNPVLGVVHDAPAGADQPEYLADVREDLAIYREQGLVHPGFLLRRANTALTRHVRLGPWLHVASRIWNRRALKIDEPFATRATVLANYERKGHLFVELGATIAVGDGDPIAHIHHTAIYRPRQVRDAA